MVGLAAACRTIQLVDARNGSARPATDVVDAALLSVAEAIGATLEGKTERQTNPHPPHFLAWLAWIIARLGGWNCYYRPPGPKTMRAGWGQFETMAAGFAVAMIFEPKSNPRISDDRQAHRSTQVRLFFVRRQDYVASAKRRNHFGQ